MIRAMGVVVPAHDEEEELLGCLAALRRAAEHPGVRGLSILLVVVLDACRDGSATVARQGLAGTLAPGSRSGPGAVQGAIVTVEAHAVGSARAAGVEQVLRWSAPVPFQDVWLATTDADSHVRTDWLAEQRLLADEGVDGIAGVIEVTDWSAHEAKVRTAYEGLLASRLRPGDRHTHVYGASLGCRASAYLDVGGFAALPTHEDRLLWAALDAAGHRMLPTTRVAVITSGRRSSRAPGGLGHLLVRMGAGEWPEVAAQP